MNNSKLKILFLFLFSVTTVLTYSQNKRKGKIADQNTQEWRYDALCNGNGGSESSYLLRISVYVPDRRLALEQAKKSAVHAVLFKGLPANNDGCAAKVQLVNASSESENSEYFKNFFFNNSSYSQFATSPTGVPTKTISLDKKGKQLRVDYIISVNVESLRKKLEGDKIIKSLAVDNSVQKPSIIIFPSKDFIIGEPNNYYTIDQNGEKIADYAAALLNPDIRTTIVNLESLLIDRGFTPKNAVQLAESVKKSKTLSEVNTSAEGTDTEVSDLDKMLAQSGADIRWDFDYTILDDGMDTKLSYKIQAFDSYSSETWAAVDGVGASSFTASIPELIKQSVTDKMDKFLSQMQLQFQDLVDNGRKIQIEVLTFDMDEYPLSMDVGEGDTLTDLVIGFIGARAMDGNFGRKITSSKIELENVRIPLTIEVKSRFGPAKPISNTAGSFIKEFQKYLQTELDIPSNYVEVGLGLVRLTIGSN